MKLTDAQAKELRTRLAPRFVCAVCGAKDDWILDPKLFALVGTEPSEPGKGVPLVLMTCRSCCHVLTFSAALLGIVRS